MAALSEYAAAQRAAARDAGLRVVQGTVVATVDASHVSVDIGGRVVTAWTAAPVSGPVRVLYGSGVTEVLSGGEVRTYSTVLSDISKATGQVITTLGIPAQPRDCRVHVTFSGVVGFSATANIAVGFTPSASAGTATWVPSHPVRCATAADWYGYGHGGTVDLPAATACTITLTASISAGNAYYAGILTASIS